MSTTFRSQQRRRPDPNIMLMANYADGRSAYFFASPQEIGLGDFLARSIATDRQASGELNSRPGGASPFVACADPGALIFTSI